MGVSHQVSQQTPIGLDCFGAGPIAYTGGLDDVLVDAHVIDGLHVAMVETRYLLVEDSVRGWIGGSWHNTDPLDVS